MAVSLKLALTLAISAILAAPAAAPAAVTRVSVGSAGAQAAGPSGGPAVSAGGRYVAFAPDAPNLVGDDHNATTDVFLRDRVTGATSRVSVGAGGAEGTGLSTAPSISGDGRIVAFVSRAADLVADDPNREGIDVFVRDVRTGRLTRLSARRDAAAQRGWISFDPAVSADGRFVAFAAEQVRGDDDGELQEAGPRRVYVYAVRDGRVERVSVSSRERSADGESGEPAISADGRYVAFSSTASHLVAGDTNRKQDVFVRDRRRGRTVRVSISASGRQGGFSSYEPAISGTGRYVAFTTRSRQLERGDLDGAADVYVR